MRRSKAIALLTPLLVIGLLRAASANGVAGCCACVEGRPFWVQGESYMKEPATALICAEVRPSEQMAFENNCAGRGGQVVCTKDACAGTEDVQCLEQPHESCVQVLESTLGIACPVARAPALGAVPTAGLALLLGAGGVAVLSRRRRTQGGAGAF